MQQINLYQTGISPGGSVLSFKQAMQLIVVMLVVVMAVSVYQLWHKHSLSKLIAQTQKQYNQIQTSVKDLSRQISAQQLDDKLVIDIKKLEAELKDKQHVLGIITNQDFGNIKGFTEQLTGLAKQHISGMWITALELKAGGTQMSLQGSSIRAELVPQFLQRLANEASLSGIEFHTFIMQSSEDVRYINFDLRSGNMQVQ